jgi:hypothetical protein
VSAPVREWLEALEATMVEAGGDDVAVAVAYAAGQAVVLDEAELAGARRRAMFVLAAGGDPHRPLDLRARAVETLAADLDDVSVRGELQAALRAAAANASGLPRVAEAVRGLLADPDRAWRAFACALLAEELAEEN